MRVGKRGHILTIHRKRVKTLVMDRPGEQQNTQPLGDDQVRNRLMAALGRQSAFWGLGKTPGEMFAALYLAAEPLSLAQLAAAAGVTKGAASVAARQLESIGLIRRSQRPGDRRVFFAAETDFWVAAQRLLERRQKPEFDESFRQVRDLLQAVRQEPSSPQRDHTLKRLENLQAFYDQLDAVVAIILRLGPHRLERLIRLGARWLPEPDGRDR